MKAAVISYSLTGNNEKLARSLAESLAAEHISIAESKRRTSGTIALDVMLNRTPKITIPAVRAEEYNLVTFVGPVWMGHVATPFRACFRQLGPKIDEYAFVSISGGADGPNPKLAAELTKRLGKEPAALVDLHIADLLPPDPKPTRNDTMGYKISEEQARVLAEKVVSALKQVTG
jgi:hypothetical protein